MIPKYQGVSNEILRRISNGTYPVGGLLPSEPVLAMEFGVARGTLRRALQTLHEQGVLQTVHGKGSYVLTRTPEGSIAQSFVGLSEAFSLSPKEMETRVLKHEIVAASTFGFLPLGINADERILHLHRVRSLAETPVADLNNWVRLSLAPGIQEYDFEESGLLEALDQVVPAPISTGQRSFEARKAPADVASRLQIAEGDPLLHLTQTTFLDTGNIVEWSQVWLNSQEVPITVNLVR